MFFALYAVLLGVALAALIMLARRARELFWRAPVLPAALQSALRELGTGDRALTTLAEELEPAWCASLLRAAVRSNAADAGPDAADAIEEALDALEQKAHAQLPALRTLARVAPPIAFVTAIVELGLAFHHQAGLLSLQKGLAESIAVSHATLAILTGMVISFVCRSATAVVHRQARTLVKDLQRCAELLEERRA